MSAHEAHEQLKTIRKIVGITQKTAADMLGVSYPYFLSIETGQRELSRPLAGRITRMFGVVDIRDKNAEPKVRDSEGRLVPFTKEYFEKRRFKQPSYFLEDTREVVVPTATDYAQCVQALLEAARQRGDVGPLLGDFFRWFERGIATDKDYAGFTNTYDHLFGGKRSDAFWALTDYRAKELDRFVWEERERLAARRAAAKKRKRKT